MDKNTRTFWTFLVVCLLSCIPGVSADETRTALIAAGIVVGVLLIIAIVIGALYCSRQLNRNEEKTLPKGYPNGTLSNGVYRGDDPRMVYSPHEDGRNNSASPRAKSYTQHAAAPRQRPPVVFYTIRADPRVPQVPPDAIPIAPPHPYRGPPPVGRPVMFLDFFNGGSRMPNGQPGQLMYPNGGTMLYYANGGPMIQEVESSGSKSSHRHRKSERKHKSRSKSRSRSRDPHDKRHSSRRQTHSDPEDLTVRPFEGDVILTTRQDDDIKKYSRATERRSTRRSDDNNNNPLQLYFDNGGLDLGPQDDFNNANSNDNNNNNDDNIDKVYSEVVGDGFVRAEQKFVSEGGRYSVTQVQTSSVEFGSPPTSTINHTILQEKEQTIGFDDEDGDSIPDPTPRIDYSRQTSEVGGFSYPEPSRVVISDGLSRSISPSPLHYMGSAEPTPRPDYLTGDTQFPATTEPVDGGIDDIIALGNVTVETTEVKEVVEEQEFISHHRQDPTLDRPPTPPFDGGESPRDSVYPPRGDPIVHHAHAEIVTSSFSDVTARIPTPPPDMTMEEILPNQDDAERRLSQLVGRPSPPPSPPLDNFGGRTASWRPPTPPPGRIIPNPDINIDDILKLGNQPLSTPQPSEPFAESNKRSPHGSQGRESGLPFMAELRKRQQSIDDGDLPFAASEPAPPQPSTSRGVGLDSDPNYIYRRVIVNEDRKDSYGYRQSTVQFAQAPPEIIPFGEDPDSPTTPRDYSGGPAFSAASPPPPPPPPPPPLPPNMKF
ncbi:formin-like protein 5 [Aplysia californica]|uniref:Formin-like protein 5 n=1 Tax=Aplysia californica TaxID=6500 RepID=A0ABM0ZXQ6_APLCA|nr:formin-like protein 5 [Aplysia californica]